MAQGRELQMMIVNDARTMFSDEELKDIIGVRRGQEYIRIKCGCTDPPHGDIEGELRIFPGGKLEIICKCNCVDCPKGSGLSPGEFAKHASGRTTGPTMWKSQIWVTNKRGRKIRLWRTSLLKYHKEAFYRPRRGQITHRDEFVACAKCQKHRRFSLRTKEECRIYHDAIADKTWTCSLFPYGKITCKTAEERQSRKRSRGCPENSACKGCTRCVCFGCSMCRYADCNCRSCLDFIGNETP